MIVIISVAFYRVFLQQQSEKSLLDRIPASKPHQHVSPDGTIVKHTHPQIVPSIPKSATSDLPTVSTDHPILRIWGNLNLDEIRRKYQPYTVAEMMEKWHQRYMDFNYPSRSSSVQTRLAQKAVYDAYCPTKEWLQRLLDYGFPFLDFGHYKMAFGTRARTVWYKEDYENPEKRVSRLEGFHLASDATWAELEEVIIKFDTVARLNEQRASDLDPSFLGGITNMSGVFMPFSQNEVKVYVHVAEDKYLSTFVGAMLSEEQKEDLTMYGVAPKGVTVVYTDKEGNPLPAGVVPRFYERKMAVLDDALTHTEKTLADHEVLFKNLPSRHQKSVVSEGQSPPSDSLQQEVPFPDFSDRDESMDTGDHPLPPPRTYDIPLEMLPKDPPSRANIAEWFAVLQELHRGDLPKDLRVLQEVISELEAIRQEGEERMKPSERPAPKPPTFPE